MKNVLVSISLAMVLAVSAPAHSTSSDTLPAKAVSSAAGLDEEVKSLVAAFKGKVSLFAKNLDTGELYTLNGDERVRTASTIKIAVMIEAFARVAEGKARWTDELVLTKAARYGGCAGTPATSRRPRPTLRAARYPQKGGTPTTPPTNESAFFAPDTTQP